MNQEQEEQGIGRVGPPSLPDALVGAQIMQVEWETTEWVSGEPVPPTAPSGRRDRWWWRLSGRRRRAHAAYRSAWAEWDAGGRKPVQLKRRTVIPRAAVRFPDDESGQVEITAYPTDEGATHVE